jgi:hypothetical protein
MAVNETLLGSTMTNFTLPSPKRHRKYEETGTIHDEVTIHYSVVWFAQRLTFRKENPGKCHFVSLSTGMFGFIHFDAVETFSFAKSINLTMAILENESVQKNIPNRLIAFKW